MIYFLQKHIIFFSTLTGRIEDNVMLFYQLFVNCSKTIDCITKLFKYNRLNKNLMQVTND